jgi:hypothetical protein
MHTVTNPPIIYSGHEECAKNWPIFKASTLKKERCLGIKGIPSHKVGSKVVYIRSELDAWLASEIAKRG